MSKIALTLSFAQSQDMAGIPRGLPNGIAWLEKRMYQTLPLHMKCQQLVFFAIRRRRDQSVSWRIMLFIAMQEL